MAKLIKSSQKKVAPATQPKPAAFKATEKFKATHVGTTLIVNIGKESYRRKATKKEADEIIPKLERYNKKPTESGKKAIIKLLSPETVKKQKEKDDLTAKAKGIKQQIKKEMKVSKVAKEIVKQTSQDLMGALETMLTDNPENVEKLQALLNKFKKVEEKIPEPVAAASSYRRPGEH